MRSLLTIVLLVSSTVSAQQRSPPVLHEASRLGPELLPAFRSAIGDALRPEEARRLDAWVSNSDRIDPSSPEGVSVRVALAAYVTRELIPALLRATHHSDVAEQMASIDVRADTRLTDIFYRHLRDRSDVPIAISNDYGLLASAIDDLASPSQRARSGSELGMTRAAVVSSDLRTIGRYLGQLTRNARNVRVPAAIIARLCS
jgi:hypothetical protein